ncbi:unnamed protein product [Peronospora belbahrii]|uniref:Uncharacterized protein n=1 Tax=Peronospora belbahrii TaxID=622444 RepID=A0ABN8CX08_9STRA|nr:unnamed protein product [Peronospora belbahrii]
MMTMNIVEVKLVEVQNQFAVSEANQFTKLHEYEENLVEVLRKAMGSVRKTAINICISCNVTWKRRRRNLGCLKLELDKEGKKHEKQLNCVLQQLQ